MRRLSQTWKQKRASDRSQHVFKQRITNVHELKNEKDNQSNLKVRVVIDLDYKISYLVDYKHSVLIPVG